MQTPRALIAASATILVVGAVVAAGHAAPAPKAPPPVRPVVSFAETYRSDPNVDVGRFVIDARIPLDPADVANFDGDTYFDAQVGWFDFDGYLSDDPNYTPGMTTATLVDVGYDGDTQLVAKLRWTPTQLLLHVTAVTGDDIDPIASDDYAYDDTGLIDDETDAEIEFGNADVYWDTLPIAGRVATWTVAGDDYSAVRTHGRAVQ